MNRFDSRNARYTSDDINERQGGRNFRAIENVNRKRTHHLKNRDDPSQRRGDVRPYIIYKYDVMLYDLIG